MRKLDGYSLWLGNLRDGHDLRAVLAAGIEVVVDLVMESPPPAVTRELVNCRFPLLDGAGNPPWLLRTAVETVAAAVQAGAPTLVFCGAGMSRSRAIAAAALARVSQRPIAEVLTELVMQLGPADASPGLWSDLLALFDLRTPA